MPTTMADMGGIGVRWVWAFLDCPVATADRDWAFWADVTRSRLAPRRGRHGEFSTLVPAKGDAWVKLQAVGGAGGVHFDLDVDDFRAASEYAVELGAIERTRLDDVIVMESPGGFAFCLTSWKEAGRPARQVRSGQERLLDQVCLDIPSGVYGGELAFWSALTGWPAVEGRRPEFHYLQPPEGVPVRLLLQRLGKAGGAVRAHPDLACADRAAEVRRDSRLGAGVVADGASWTVMRTPGGQVYCLTDRVPLTGQLPPSTG